MTWQAIEFNTDEEGLTFFGFDGPSGYLQAPVMTASTRSGRKQIGIMDVDGNPMLHLSHADDDDEECLSGIMRKACDLLNFAEQQIDHEMEPKDASTMLQSTISSILLGQLQGI